jgi:MFS family permease
MSWSKREQDLRGHAGGGHWHRGARYISPTLRTRMYSVRFFVGFLGSAAAAPPVGFLHERTGNLTAVTLVLAAFTVISIVCALFFPDRKEELQPELWGSGVRG